MLQVRGFRLEAEDRKALTMRKLQIPLAVLLLGVLTWAPPTTAGDQAPAREEMAEFLRSARIIGSRQVGKGVTGISRLTLTDGRRTQDAAFQAVDVRKPLMRLRDGTTELHFADSYHFNIAGYRLAELIGLGDMVPVTVARRWRGRNGALSWWVESEWDEGSRRAAGVEPPDPASWNQQIYRERVFAALIGDTDRNEGNMIITRDWKVWMIDFTRAFRRNPEPRGTAALHRCDRLVLQRLRELTREQVATAVGRHLNRFELDGLMARRDSLLEHFDRLIAEQGEHAVLY
jgi:hypothetical protein